jgi:hypothetical protein
MLKIKTFILLNCPLIKFENLIKTFNPQDHLNRRNNKLEKHTTKQHMQGCNKRSLMTKIKREKKKKTLQSTMKSVYSTTVQVKPP